MYKNKKIAVVIPAHNEETQIGRVIETMPDFVDRMVIIDDKSSDRTVEVVQKYQKSFDQVVLIQHEKNKGVGGAIATGYEYARDNHFDVAVVMAGDGQMAPSDLPAILDPVVDGKADYSKGNRLFTGEAYQKIPKVRYFGNAFLSLWTKVASGYWHIADSQSGYTAISRKALATIDWTLMYPIYGQPNDLLVRLNVHNFRVKDVPVEPVYNIGEKSGIRIRKVIFTIGWLLIRLFFWRMKEKYIIRDFHPLVFFYFLGGFFYLMMILLFARVFYHWLFYDHIPAINALAAFFSFMSGSLFTLFAMWFDMEANKDLK
jgi:glycosyltransferase involved in cell wall biosynthesis